LAREAGQSRPVLAERGMPPMPYLASWRMEIASERLSGGKAKLASIPAGIGYESEAAFSRAFNKPAGVQPSE
jgi:AraC-like DNA-binding protein